MNTIITNLLTNHGIAQIDATFKASSQGVFVIINLTPNNFEVLAPSIQQATCKPLVMSLADFAQLDTTLLPLLAVSDTWQSTEVADVAQSLKEQANTPKQSNKTPPKATPPTQSPVTTSEDLFSDIDTL